MLTSYICFSISMRLTFTVSSKIKFRLQIYLNLLSGGHDIIEMHFGCHGRPPHANGA